MQKFWSSNEIKSRIDSENYDLLLFSGENEAVDDMFAVSNFRGVSFWGQDLLDDAMRHYRVLCAVPGHLALVPRNRQELIQATDIGLLFKETCSPSDRRLEVAPNSR